MNIRLIEADFALGVVVMACALNFLPWGGQPAESVVAAPQTTMELLDSAMGVRELILANMDRFATPEYLHWKASLRSFQREHYASILMHVRKGDAGGALLSYLRMKLRLEFSMNHKPITFRNARGEEIPLPQDWSFPRDPWATEKK
jgi:hypothetical protein